jgi:hypothetical protein
MEHNECQSHEDREAQTLVKRIEKNQASQEAAREAETKRTLDDYGKKSAAKPASSFGLLNTRAPRLGLGQLTLVAPTPRPRQPSVRTTPLAAPVAESQRQKSRAASFQESVAKTIT